MIPKLDITKIDWTNPDVNKVFEYFSAKFDQKKKENKQKDETIKQKDETIKQKYETIKQLRKEILQLKTAKHNSRKARSYNVREFKDYPRPKNSTKKQSSNTTPITRTDTADQQYCPCCGDKLSDMTDSYTRTAEDVLNGKLVNLLHG